MVQSVSQYEFIYEYILDYLSSTGMIKLKWPRNAFGLDDDQVDRHDADNSPTLFENEKSPELEFEK